MRTKECTKIREEQARWLKEGPNSRQRADHEILRTELRRDLERQYQTYLTLLDVLSESLVESAREHGSEANDSVGGQTNNTRSDH